MLDRVIFGDNQFFGINHMSEAKAQALSEKFRDLQSIIEVIDMAYDCGIRGFMLNSHEKSRDICEHLRRNPSRYAGLNLYPSIPYAHKYANAVAEKGIFATLKEAIVSGSTFSDVAGLITKGGSLLFEKDMLKVMQMLVDVEMKIFRGLNIKVLFLQNIVTDLMLGFGVREVFVGYASYLKNTHGIEPGFVTMNMPKLVDFLLDCGIENPVVCSSINKAGYFMNPDQASYEKALREKPFRPVAMSILASGAVRPEEAVAYINNQPEIQAVVFGASSRSHIQQTKALIEGTAPDYAQVPVAV
jgi:hypothetical protein